MKKLTTVLASILSLSIAPIFAQAPNIVVDLPNPFPMGSQYTLLYSYSDCYNVMWDVYCAPCEDLCFPVRRSPSLIVGGSLRYYTWSFDYKSRTDPSGCSPCGGVHSESAGARLPELDITRFFEPESYTREHLTFGALHGMKTYDQRLVFTAGHSAVEVDDYGAQASKRSLNFNVAQQCWIERLDRRDVGVASLHLFDSAGLPVITAAARNTAHTAIRMNFDGSSVHFEVLWNATGAGIARPVAFLDRHGNAIEVEYTDAQPTFGTPALENFRPYFRKTLMRDAYGREAQFTYEKLFHKYVATRIDLPNGGHISYHYIWNGGVQLEKCYPCRRFRESVVQNTQPSNQAGRIHPYRC